MIDAFTIPEGFADDQAVEWVIDWEAANDALAGYLEEQERSEKEKLAAEVAAAHEAALLEDEQRSFAWELVIDWAYAEDAEFDAALEAAEAEAVEEEEVSDVTFSGPVVVEPIVAPTAPAPAQTNTASITADLIEQLKQLKELHTIGVLDDDEFKAAKGAIIEKMKAPVAAPSAKSIQSDEPQLSLAV
jgi:hypothetical protein